MRLKHNYVNVTPGITTGTWASGTPGKLTIGSSTGVLAGVNPGTSTITYTTTGAGCSATQAVTDNPTPVITGTTSFIVCGLNTTTLNVSPGITTGTWASGTPGNLTIGSGTGVLAGVNPGTSTITYTTTGAGCSATQAVTDNPTPVITGTTSFIVCGLNTTTLNVSPGITTGTWASGTPGNLTIGSGTGVLAGVNPGTSTITYTTTGAGCSTTQVVTDNPTPVITGTTSFIVCGLNTTTLNVSPGITTGTWASGTPGNLTIGSGTGVLAGVNSGTSTITYTTTGAGCSTTQVVTDNATPVITGITSFIVCGANTTTLGISPGITGGTWSSSNASAATIGSLTGLVTGGNAGPATSTITYTTTGAGCTATRVVTDNPIPVITGTTSFIVCGTSSTTLGISPGITGGTWLAALQPPPALVHQQE